MNWVVEFHEDFEPEFDALPNEVRKRIKDNLRILLLVKFLVLVIRFPTS